MEIVTGRIIDITPDGLTVYVPYRSVDRLCARAYAEAQVGLPDGRRISPEQRRKAYALLGEIAAYTGYTTEEAKLTTKHEFVERHLEGLQKELFSLSNCDMTTAKEYIGYLIDFIIAFGIPTKVPLVEYCEDISRYVCQCLAHKQCAVCGKRCDLHHVDRIGMGGDRKRMNHIGLRCLPLCREHHQEAHSMGDEAMMDRYHLTAVPIDHKIAKLYKLGKEQSV